MSAVDEQPVQLSSAARAVLQRHPALLDPYYEWSPEHEERLKAELAALPPREAGALINCAGRLLKARSLLANKQRGEA